MSPFYFKLTAAAVITAKLIVVHEKTEEKNNNPDNAIVTFAKYITNTSVAKEEVSTYKKYYPSTVVAKTKKFITTVFHKKNPPYLLIYNIKSVSIIRKLHSKDTLRI